MARAARLLVQNDRLATPRLSAPRPAIGMRDMGLGESHTALMLAEGIIPDSRRAGPPDAVVGATRTLIPIPPREEPGHCVRPRLRSYQLRTTAGLPEPLSEARTPCG